MTALCLTVLTASAQKLQVAKPKVNVGKTGFKMPVTATFELKNVGSRHLTIASVEADCGCTEVDYPRKSIAGGTAFTITMTYDARMLGHFTKQSAVYVKGSNEPVWLTMEGVVLTEWTDYSKMYPFAFGNLLADVNNVEFDDVNKGDHPEVVINVLNNGEKTVTPNMLHLPDYLTALAVPEKLEPEKQGKVTLTLNSDKLQNYGLTQTTIYLAEQLGDKVNADTELPVSVVLLHNADAFKGSSRKFAPKLELSVDSLNLGMTGRKLVKRGTIKLTNKGQTPLKISSLQMFAQGMTVMLGKQELAAGQSTSLKVDIDRDVVLKARQRPRVLMITNDPDHSKVVIKVNVK
jgi:hypothetical protein